MSAITSIQQLSKKDQASVGWALKCFTPDVLESLGWSAEDLEKHILTNKPVTTRKPRAPKASSEERSQQVHNPELCDARIWLKGGYAGQCSRKKKDDQCLCTFHQKESDNHNGNTRFGLFLTERFTHAYNDTNDDIHLWNDVERPQKVKKTSQTGKRKCGLCGELGHNRRRCPQLNNTQGEDDGSGTGLNLCQPCNTSSSNLSSTQEQFNNTNISLSQSMADQEQVEDTQEQVEDTQEQVEDTQELVEDTQELVEEPIDEPLDEDLSCTTEEEEEVSEPKVIDVDGIKYFYDPEESQVLSNNMDPIDATWDPDQEKIYWNNDSAELTHHRLLKKKQAHSKSD